MRNLLLRFIISVIAIGVITSGILPGVRIVGNAIPTVALVGVIFALVNILIKPLVKLLACSIIVLTLGLFTFIINGAMLALAAALATPLGNLTGGRLLIENFGSAVIAALIISIVTMAMERILGVKEAAAQTRQYTEVRYVVERERPNYDRQFEQMIAPPPPPPGYNPPGTPQDYDFDDPNFPRR